MKVNQAYRFALDPTPAQEAFRDLGRALRDFTASKKGTRKARRLGFPRFKKRGRCRDSFRFSTGTMRCSGRSVTLPRPGTISTHESTRKLARRREDGTARVLAATVSRTAQRSPGKTQPRWAPGDEPGTRHRACG
jgi:transposase